MKEFYTSVVELSQPIDTAFVSEPYECGWADEAIFFLTLHPEQAKFERVLVQPQLSPDGIHWVDAPSGEITVMRSGLYALRQTHFGGWLRVKLTLEGAARTAMITLHLALKG